MDPSGLYCQTCFQPVPPGSGVCRLCYSGCSMPFEELPSLRKDRLSDGTWVCSKCSVVYPPSITKCQSCGYVMLDQVPISSEIEDPRPPAPPTPSLSLPSQSIWTCSCGYEYNLAQTSTCTKCHQPRNNPLTLLKLWKCAMCSYEYNQYGQPCVRCSKSERPVDMNPGLVRGNNPGFSHPNSPFWTCGCGSRQQIAKCSKCQQWRPNSSRLPYFQPKPELPKWNCQTCSRPNNLDRDTCEQCTCSRWRNTMNISAGMIMGKWGWVCPTCLQEQLIESNKCMKCNQLSPIGEVMRQHLRP